jgi:phosphopantothenoylcysteine decarboxylase/phosphopantothenate--cysteine ligase
MTNHSTGKQGYALAQRARDLGADVILVSGPCNLTKPDGVSFVPVKSAVEMQQAMEKAAESADWIIMAAAVADYRPASCALQKIKKSDSNMTVEFVRNPDILKGLGEKKREDQVLCGFAMETENLLENAKKKLEGKHCDLLAANNLNTPGAGFANDTNVISLLSKEGVRQLPLLSKEDTADAILLRMLEISREKKKGN